MFEDLNPLDKSTAIFEIVIMLLIAFLIGYFTRWFASRKKLAITTTSNSSDNPESIKNIKEEYQYKLNKVNTELDNLKIQLSEKDKSFDELKEELIEQEKLNYELEHTIKKPAPKFTSKEEAAKVLGFKLADEEHKEDLTVIKGVGPFIQEKLNELGIYTIEQISDFTIDTVIKVTEAIEFFPGRIQRDFWVEQANQIVNDRKEKLISN